MDDNRVPKTDPRNTKSDPKKSVISSDAANQGRNAGRRRMLSIGVGALLAAPTILRPVDSWATPDIVQAPGKLGSVLTWWDTRRIDLVHSDSGDVLDMTYFRRGAYVRGALEKASRFLRDRNTDEAADIDPSLLDLLHAVREDLDLRKPMQVISGFRSETTNKKLRRRTSRAARNSLHLEAKAVDVRVEDMDSRRIREAALNFKAGGVGYYGRWNYIHLDVGPYRYWTRQG